MKEKILVDANTLLVLILGLMNPNEIKKNKRTSLFKHINFDDLLELIGDPKNLITIPNVWTEVDNLLNGFSGEKKFLYLTTIKDTIKKSTEICVSSKNLLEYLSQNQKNYLFENLGVTDSTFIKVALERKDEIKFLLTSDSDLSDYANALGIRVFDMVGYANVQLLK